MESVTPPFADFALEIYAASRGYFVPPALVREALGSSSHCFSLPPWSEISPRFFCRRHVRLCEPLSSWPRGASPAGAVIVNAFLSYDIAFAVTGS